MTNDGEREESSFDALLGALARAPALPVALELARGTRVGRYVVAELLGKGATGAVYRAHDEVLRRDVALKVLRTPADASHATVDRFRREVIALASVSHENVVTVHDAGAADGQVFVVLALARGRTLRERVRAGALPASEALAIARQLARGLEAAHAVGVIHRDIKPENVLLDESGVAKIADFGLARLLERSENDELGHTDSGVVLGTAHYMAPEQVRGEAVDARADLFALGAVIVELLTGRRAFDGASRAEVISAVLRDDPFATGTFATDLLTRRLLGVAQRCLEKSRERRFASATEVLRALDDDAAVLTADTSVPETRYATTSGVHIAYQVVSPAGPPTLLSAPPFISNIDMIWDSPQEREWLRAMSSFSHFIHYDRRGVGMSDPVAPECAMEDRVEDLRAVLDAENVERAFLLGVSEGGPVSIAFAAKYPDRVRGLVLMNSFASLVRSADYEHGLVREDYEHVIDKWVRTWGTPKSLSLRLFVPGRANDPDFVRWANRYERQCASPGTMRRLLNMQFDIDVRPLLAQVRCPVLVTHCTGDRAIVVEHGRYLQRHLPNAAGGVQYVEIESVAHAPAHGDPARLVALTRAFVEEVSAARSP